jgi:membrane protein
MGAALAYYAVFSTIPLLLIAIALLGFLYGKEAAQGRISGQLENLIGRPGAQAIEALLASAGRPGSGYVATGIGFFLLVFGAMGFFGELKDSLNTVWDVAPKAGAGWWTLVTDRVPAFAFVLLTILVLFGSLLVSMGLAALENLFGDWFPSALGHGIDFIVSFGVITVLFATILRWLPDVRLAWGDVWLGAAITSLLYAIGKGLLGVYLSHSTVASAYGAAGSVVALLIWAYYSAQIFLFGAELTRVFAEQCGSWSRPYRSAGPQGEC